MYCPRCGVQNDDAAAICIGCNGPLAVPAPAAAPATPVSPGLPPPPRMVAPIENYLVWAILVTVCCCSPVGVAAVYFSAQVSPRIAGGDLDGARACSRKALTWTLVAFGLGLVAWACYFLLSFLGGNMLEPLKGY